MDYVALGRSGLMVSRYVLGTLTFAGPERLMLRGDNSVQLTVHLNNAFSKELAIYDGPARIYGIIVRAKGAAPQRALHVILCLCIHAGTTFLSVVRPSCRERRAASSVQPIATAISRCGRSAM